MLSDCKKRIRKIRKLEGFSLGEVLLSVFILATALTTSVGLMAANLRYMINSQDRVIATGLAQEGTELVMNIRDTNWEKGDEAFENGFPGNSGNNYTINYNSSNLTSGNRHLRLNNYDFYTHSGSTPTKFQRKIIVSYYDSNGLSTNRAGAEEAEITSVVIWGNNFPVGSDINSGNCNISNKCVFSKMTLFKWK